MKFFSHQQRAVRRQQMEKSLDEYFRALKDLGQE